MKISKKYIKFIILTFIAFLLVYILLQFTSLQSFKQTFSQITLSLFFGGLILYFLIILLRSVQLKYVANNKVSLKDSLFINSFGLFSLNILPFRSGELSYLYLLRKKKLSIHSSLSCLYVLRLSEFTAMFSILFLSFLYVGLKNVMITKIIFISAIFMAILAIIFLIIIFKTSYLRIFKHIIYRVIPARQAKKIVKFFSGVLQSVKEIGITKTIVAILMALIVALIKMTLSYAFFIILVQPASFILILFGLSLFFIISALPINPPGNLGTFEGILTSIFVALEFSVEKLVNYSFILHFFILFYGLFYSLFFYSYSKIKFI